MKSIPFHPLANLFPLIEGDDFDRLVEDIRTNGLRDKIIMLDDQIIDGRNRYRALIAADLLDPSRLQKWSDCSYFWGIGDVGGYEDDPLALVLSKNLHRRHLSTSQRAMIAARLATMKSGTRTDIIKDKGAEPRAILPEVSNSEAADQLKVSPRSVKSAKKVLESGTTELQDVVTRGEMAVSAAANIAELPVDEQVRAIESADPKAFAKVAKAKRDQKTAEKKQARTVRERQLGEKQLALPDRKFGVIYADPEWKFEPYSQNTGMDRSADNHYPTSNVQDILARRVQDISAPDAVLFLWATVPMLEDALDVMGGWNFKYRSHFVWAKDRAGTGYWNRNAHEFLLVGTRGNVPAPAPGTQWPSVIEAPVGRHSEKPEIFHFLIEHYFPTLPKIELNARKNRPGWTIWGLEADGEDLSGEPLLENPGWSSFSPPGAGTGCEEPPADRSAPSRSRERKQTGASELDSPPPKESFMPPSLSGLAPTGCPAPPPKESFMPPSASSCPSKACPGLVPGASPPISARVNIGDLELLVRCVDDKIKFYAMQEDRVFPAESGWVEAACTDEATVENIDQIARRIWGDVVPDRGAPLRLPAVTYRMGRTGPVPVKKPDQHQGGE